MSSDESNTIGRRWEREQMLAQVKEAWTNEGGPDMVFEAFERSVVEAAKYSWQAGQIEGLTKGFWIGGIFSLLVIGICAWLLRR